MKKTVFILIFALVASLLSFNVYAADSNSLTEAEEARFKEFLKPKVDTLKVYLTSPEDGKIQQSYTRSFPDLKPLKNVETGEHVMRIIAKGEISGNRSDLFENTKQVQVQKNQELNVALRLNLSNHLQIPFVVSDPVGDYEEGKSYKVQVVDQEDLQVSTVHRAKYEDGELKFSLYVYKPFDFDEVRLEINENRMVFKDFNLKQIMGSDKDRVELEPAQDLDVGSINLSVQLGPENVVSVPGDYISIREAVRHFTQNGEKGIIVLDSGEYVVGGGIEINDENIIITANSYEDVTIKSEYQTFRVVSGGKLTLDNVTVKRMGAGATYAGAAIFSEFGTQLVINNCRIQATHIGVTTNYANYTQIKNTVFEPTQLSDNVTGVQINHSNPVAEEKGAHISSSLFKNLDIGIDLSSTYRDVELQDNKFDSCQQEVKE